jgi:hypothetical protein
MRRKINLIIDDLEESVYLLELDGFERISSYIREAIGRIREVQVLENEIESLKIENENLRNIVASNEKS